MNMATTGTNTVYNHDVVGFWNRLNRFASEVSLAVSSNVSLTNAFDITRLTSYLDAIDRFHDWVKAQPQLDLPETSPRQYELEPWEITMVIENEDMEDMLRLLILTRDEMVNSQSARLGSGILAPDSARVTALVAKARAFLTQYIIPTQPLDLPESSPTNLMTPAGKTGV
jgi:hypothetical protein